MGKAGFKVEDVLEVFKHLLEEKPSFAFLIPLILVCWGIEKWVFSFSNWVPLVVAIWATFQASLFAIFLSSVICFGW